MEDHPGFPKIDPKRLKAVGDGVTRAYERAEKRDANRRERDAFMVHAAHVLPAMLAALKAVQACPQAAPWLSAAGAWEPLCAAIAAAESKAAPPETEQPEPSKADWRLAIFDGKTELGWKDWFDQQADADCIARGVMRQVQDIDAASVQDVHVFESAADGDDHPLPWAVQWADGALLYTASEDVACAVQRQWRTAIGLDPMTGKRHG